MLKATMKGPDGRKVILIGLSFKNLDRFREQAGDTFIHIDGKEMGLPVDLMIFSGETEAHCVKTIEEGIGPNTKVTVSGRLKSEC
jgi:hypothetical protein